MVDIEGDNARQPTTEHAHAPYCPAFQWRFAWSSGEVIEIGVRVEGRWVWGGPEPVAVSGIALLSFLASQWPVLMGDFLAVPVNNHALVDFGLGVGHPDLPRLQIEVDGRCYTIRTESFEVSPGSETLMVAESLVVLGEALAIGLAEREIGADAVGAWMSARSLDDLPPVDMEDFEEEVSPEFVDEAVAYYARRLGMSPEIYRRATLWESAYHVLHYTGQKTGPESLPMDGLWSVVMGTLPSGDVVDDMVARAIPLDVTGNFAAPDGFARWVQIKLLEQNLNVRAHLFYRGWPRRLEVALKPVVMENEDLIGSTWGHRRETGVIRVIERAGHTAAGVPMLRVRRDNGEPYDISAAHLLDMDRLSHP